MVFVLKYRKNLISDEVFEFLKGVFTGVAQRYYLSFEAIGSDGNHLYIVVEGAPRYAPSDIMRICKSITAIQLFKKFPKLKTEFWGGEFWSDGGHIDTVGDGRGLDEVKKYVENQGGKDYAQMKLFEFPSDTPGLAPAGFFI